jgi:hypothetical protein
MQPTAYATPHLPYISIKQKAGVSDRFYRLKNMQAKNSQSHGAEQTTT